MVSVLKSLNFVASYSRGWTNGGSPRSLKIMVYVTCDTYSVACYLSMCIKICELMLPALTEYELGLYGIANLCIHLPAFVLVCPIRLFGPVQINARYNAYSEYADDTHNFSASPLKPAAEVECSIIGCVLLTAECCSNRRRRSCSAKMAIVT